MDDISVLQPDSMGEEFSSGISSGISGGGSGLTLQQPCLDLLCSSPPVPGWAWVAPAAGDAEEGGAAGSSS
jgi:hypothetical protein